MVCENRGVRWPAYLIINACMGESNKVVYSMWELYHMVSGHALSPEVIAVVGMVKIEADTRCCTPLPVRSNLLSIEATFLSHL